MEKKNSGLTRFILIMLFLGALSGIFLSSLGEESAAYSFLVHQVFDVGARLFLASLKMLVVPVVFISLVLGVASLDNIENLGRLGMRTFSLYLLTTGIATALAISVALLFAPGKGFNLELNQVFDLSETPSLKETLVGLFPTNPFQAFSEGNMLQIIVFALFVGYALLRHRKKHQSKGKILPLFEEANALILFLVGFFMKLAPYGVFCIMAKVFAENGFEAFKPLMAYFLCVLGTLALHVLFTYFTLLRFGARMKPFDFLRKIKSPLVLAFGTASSSVTLPVTLKTVMKELGVDRGIASFSLSLGATINMDGTAIMQGVATVFIAQAYNIDIGLAGYVTVIAMATLASIGTAGVPGVGLLTLAMVLRQVGLPVEGIGLILGVDRLLDMFRTAVNVSGDATIACFLGRLDKKRASA